MNRPPPPAGGALPGSAGSQAGATQEIGLQVLARFSALVRVARSYQPDNQVVTAQIEALVQTLAPVLEEKGEAVLVALEDDLYLNGARVPIHSKNLRFYRHVMEEFKRRHISGVRIQQGVTLVELIQFFRLFLQPELYKGLELLTACLANGTDHVLPAVHASTEDPGGEEFDPPWDETEEPAAEGDSPANRGGWENMTVAEQAKPRRRAAPPGAARKEYTAAIQGARSLLAATSLQGGMELRHAKRVVQPLVDGAFASEPVVVGLSSLSRHDEYTYAHAVNVCLVAVSMGRFLEMDRRAMADLGVAALLHDVGKAAVSGEIHRPLELFTAEERAAATRHPLEGAKLLARSTTLNQTTLRCMRVALEHHMGLGPDGYPESGEVRPSMLSRVVQVADCYVSLQTHRSPRGARVTPYQALGMMLGPLKGRFHAGLLWALVQTVGFYPSGQLVELDDGSLAVVLAPNEADPARPHVRIMFTPARKRLSPEETFEIRPLPRGRSVRRALPAEEYPTEDDAQAA